MDVIVEAPTGVTYDLQNRVVVAWGKNTDALEPLPVDVSFFGLDSILPPPWGRLAQRSRTTGEPGTVLLRSSRRGAPSVAGLAASLDALRTGCWSRLASSRG